MLLRVTVNSLVVDFEKVLALSATETVTVKPLEKDTGGTTNQNSLYHSEVATSCTGVSQTRVISSVAPSCIVATGVSTGGFKFDGCHGHPETVEFQAKIASHILELEVLIVPNGDHDIGL